MDRHSNLVNEKKPEAAPVATVQKLTKVALKGSLVEANHLADNEGKPKHYRGPYKKYTYEMKKKVMDLLFSGAATKKEVARKFDIPVKCIENWKVSGI